MATTAFPLNAELTAIAIGYRNRDIDLIADRVLPYVDRTGKKFSYTVYTQSDAYTLPATRVGRKSAPTEVDFGGALTTAECVDWGLDDVVPNDEMDAFAAMIKPASGGPVSPLAKSTSLLTGLIQLDREQRVANLVFASGTYPAANRTTLSGTSQWSDQTNSNPVTAIMAGLDVPLFRPNTLVFGQATWTAVRTHPKVLQGVFGSAQTAGAATREQVAALFEVSRIEVGAGWVNTARRGQTPTYARVWGKHASALFLSEDAANADQPTFGWTARFGTRIAGTMPEPKMGLRGSVRVRVGESVLEVISANNSGYFWQDATA